MKIKKNNISEKLVMKKILLQTIINNKYKTLKQKYNRIKKKFKQMIIKKILKK